MQYWLFMERRQTVEDANSILEAHCYNIAGYERWKQVYNADGAGGDWGQAFDGEPEMAITDPGDLDAFFNRLAEQQGMTGAQAEAAIRAGNPLGEGWTGRMRV